MNSLKPCDNVSSGISSIQDCSQVIITASNHDDEDCENPNNLNDTNLAEPNTAEPNMADGLTLDENAPVVHEKLYLKPGKAQWFNEDSTQSTFPKDSGMTTPVRKSVVVLDQRTQISILKGTSDTPQQNKSKLQRGS